MSQKRHKLGILIATILLSCALSTGGSTTQGSAIQPPPPDLDLEQRIEAMMGKLSVEERVGQLFMVSFVGQSATPADAISILIRDYKIGGVVLFEANNNIRAENTPEQVANLANQLQTRAFEAYENTRARLGDPEFYLPLFIAIDHEGDGFPRQHLRDGFTAIPSAMALGATWSPADVEAVGSVIGQELAMVGINVLLGPVVDVLEKPHPEGSGDINIRAFGGSPFWVGQMGRAYIRGVHQGSGGRVLTVAKHFPGHGASDRLPDDEVATVNKTLQELRQSDLVPFFAVTQSDETHSLGVTDAMMPSHIRYRGFQGDVTQLTQPISLDREGMGAIMDLPTLSEWRARGLIVCDSLGVLAVKRHYDPRMEAFPASQVAKDALMAGNDLLPLVNFGLGKWPDYFSVQLPTIRETIEYFQEQYRADELFQKRADDALRHILRAKLQLYPEFTLEQATVSGEIQIGWADQIIASVAQKALTLLHPSLEELPARLPSRPRIDDEILIMGCFEDCPRGEARIQGDTVRDALLDLYGPSGSDLIDPERVHVKDFSELRDLMSGSLPDDQAQEMIRQIQSTDWIIIVLINYMGDSTTGAAKRFLASPNATVGDDTTYFDLQGKNVVALALHAPYYLDQTEISKLSAYFAVYSKVKPSLRVALRALFREVPAASACGASPVSIEGTNYALEKALSPDPARPLKLQLMEPDRAFWKVGDIVHIQVGPIEDHNGHPVADGTYVLVEGNYADQPDVRPARLVTSTVQGVARAALQITAAGRFELKAESNELGSAPTILQVAADTPTPTLTPTPTRTPTSTATFPPPTVTSTAIPSTTSQPTPTATTPAPKSTATARPPVARGVTQIPTDRPTPDGFDPILVAFGAMLLLVAVLVVVILAYLLFRPSNVPLPEAARGPVPLANRDLLPPGIKSNLSNEELADKLITILDERFSDSGLRRLAVPLNVDYDDLHGAAQAEKAQSLVEYLIRRDRFYEVISIGKQKRRDIDWDGLLLLRKAQ